MRPPLQKNVSLFWHDHLGERAQIICIMGKTRTIFWLILKNIAQVEVLYGKRRTIITVPRLLALFSNGLLELFFLDQNSTTSVSDSLFQNTLKNLALVSVESIVKIEFKEFVFVNTIAKLYAIFKTFFAVFRRSRSNYLPYFLSYSLTMSL